MKQLQCIVFLFFITCTPAFSAEVINLVGTENGEVIFKALGVAFEKQHSGVRVKVPESIDSGGGIKAVAQDKALIARVARDFNEMEKRYGLTFVPFAKVQIVFFVHKDVNISDISSKQILDIYSGKIKNWKNVGGNDLKIRVVTREQGDSAVETLEECILGFDDIEILPRSKTVFTESQAVDIVQKKKGAIGFGTYGIAKNTDVRILKIDNKNPMDTAYKCAHVVGLVFKEKNKTGIIKEFVEFAKSQAAHDAVKSVGGTPF